MCGKFGDASMGTRYPAVCESSSDLMSALVGCAGDRSEPRLPTVVGARVWFRTVSRTVSGVCPGRDLAKRWSFGGQGKREKEG